MFSWCYLYGVKVGVICVDLDGNLCGELEEQYIVYVCQQLEEVKVCVQVQCVVQQVKKCEVVVVVGQQDEGVCCECKLCFQQLCCKEGVEQCKLCFVVVKVLCEECFILVLDVFVLIVGQVLKVKVGNNVMDVIVLEIIKDGVCVQLIFGMLMIVCVEYLVF